MTDDERAEPAKWQNWHGIKKAGLWELVALSLGAEPTSIPGIDWGWREDPFSDVDKEFRERLDTSCRHVENGSLAIADPSSFSYFCKVRVCDFIGWASRPVLKWLPLPPQFLALSEAKEANPLSRSVEANDASTIVLAESKLSIRPIGYRVLSAAKAEQACAEWLADLTERPRNKTVAFDTARQAVASAGELSRKAFDRVWARAVPLGWRHAGARKKERRN